MANNGSASAITWRQLGIMVTVITAILVFFTGYMSTKADDQDVIDAEKRCVDRITEVKESLKEDIREIKDKQDKIYDLLLKHYRNHYPYLKEPPEHSHYGD